MTNPQSFDELAALCRTRVGFDRTQFGVDSEFLPNPQICSQPTFCLIGMEPSVKNGGLQRVREDIQQGYLNFLYSEEDFILHYCAYTFLCSGSFAYNITDLSKGAMSTDDAKRTAAQRYPHWLALLRDELRLLRDPKTIVVGNGLNDRLKQLGFDADHFVPHYSWSGSKCIKNAYQDLSPHPSPAEFDAFQWTLRLFSDQLMQHVGYTDEMRQARLARRFVNPLRPFRRRLLAVYRTKFLEIRNSHLT